MPHPDAANLVYLNVSDPQLEAALATALRAHGFAVRSGLPEAPFPLCILLEDAPPAAADIALRLQDLTRSLQVVPPLLLVATQPGTVTRQAALQAGADDLAHWPAEAEALAAKAAALLRRRDADVDCNPVSGLPGARALVSHLRDTPAELAVVSFDLRHFKAYNDHYGFARGNRVISYVADVLRAVAGSGAMVYHIGGDDFIVTAPTQHVEGLTRTAVELFSRGIAAHYDAPDWEAGHIPGKCRQTGDPMLFGPLALTVVWTDARGAGLSSPDDIASDIARLRADAKDQRPAPTP